MKRLKSHCAHGDTDDVFEYPTRASPLELLKPNEHLHRHRHHVLGDVGGREHGDEDPALNVACMKSLVLNLVAPPHAHSRVQLDPKDAILKALTQHLFQRRRHRLHRDYEVTKVVLRGDGKFSESGHSAIRVNFLDIPL